MHLRAQLMDVRTYHMSRAADSSMLLSRMKWPLILFLLLMCHTEAHMDMNAGGANQITGYAQTLTI